MDTLKLRSLSNVIIIGSAYPLRGGGIATFNERLAKAFNQEGHQTTIYTFSLQYPNFLFPGSSQYSEEPAPQDIDIKVCINSINPFNWIKVGLELKKMNPDLIVVRYWLPFMGPCLGTILRIVKGNHSTKIVCIADNIIPHEKRPGDNLFTKYFIQPVDAFITMSEKVLADLDLFNTKNKNKLFVPHPLYDNFGEIISQSEAIEKLRLDPSFSYILFFGFIRKYKGLDLIIRAMKDIPNLNIKLIVAGEFYDDSKQYHQLVEDLGLNDRIIFKTNFIQDSQVKYYFCASDLVVQPYKAATQSGVTPLAYHFETPMVVTNVGGLTAMVPNGKVGLIAEPTKEDLALKITEFYSHNYKEVFIQNIKVEKKKYSWKSMVNSILHLSNQPI